MRGGRTIALKFIDRIGMVFAKEHCFKEQNMTSVERYVARLKPGSTADLMRSIEDRLVDYALFDDAGCGELLKKVMRYARAEWPAMKRVLESGDVEQYQRAERKETQDEPPQCRQYRKREFCDGQRLHVLGDRELANTMKSTQASTSAFFSAN